mmetsp:Transcript_28344/g.80086  ORF Transcript_28344/g.80086 Transcript_28344/m.80086 type:complete len:120 (+) Transcript_28344:244-603(+)
MSARAVPYHVPAVGARCANLIVGLLALVVASLYFLLDLPLLLCAVAAAAAWIAASATRFLLLQVPAFEVWHSEAKLHSGLETWRPAELGQLLGALQARGVALSEKAMAAVPPRCAPGGG